MKHKRQFRVYVAGPISSIDANNPAPAYEQINENVRNALQVGYALIQRGHAPFVPHLSHYWNLVTPVDYERWLSLDFSFLAVCDVVLRLDRPSAGADKECAYAESLGIPVFTSLDALEAWAIRKRRGVR